MSSPRHVVQRHGPHVDLSGVQVVQGARLHNQVLDVAQVNSGVVVQVRDEAIVQDQDVGIGQRDVQHSDVVKNQQALTE